MAQTHDPTSRVARELGDEIRHVTNLPPAVLYALSAPLMPRRRVEVIQRAAAGESVTPQTVGGDGPSRQARDRRREPAKPRPPSTSTDPCDFCSASVADADDRSPICVLCRRRFGPGPPPVRPPPSMWARPAVIGSGEKEPATRRRPHQSD